MGATNFSGPVVSANGFEGAIQLPTFTVATAPAATGLDGTAVYVSDGAAGAPIMAFSDGTDWLRSDTGAAIAAA